MIPNILDFIMLTFIAACYFLSSLRGGVKQLYSFIVIFASFFIAGRFYPGIAAVFPEKVFPVSFSGASAFVVLFIAAFGSISLVGKLLDDLFKRLHFGGIDRTVSILLGVLKGFVLACITMVIIIVTYPADNPTVADSVGARYIMPVARSITKLLPEEEQKKFHIKERELKEIWETTAEEE